MVVRAAVQPDQALELTLTEGLLLVEEANRVDNARINTFLMMQRWIASLIYNSNVDKKHQKTPEQLMPLDTDLQIAKREKPTSPDKFKTASVFAMMDALKNKN